MNRLANAVLIIESYTTQQLNNNPYKLIILKSLMKKDKQAEIWSSEFGNSYTERNDLTQEELDNLYINNFGISRTELNKEFLSGLNKSIKVLDVGCNTGMQLLNLKNLGFGNLTGIDISKSGLKIAKRNLPEANFLEVSALNIPFKNGEFGLVFTSGVLIHIHPDNLPRVIDEIYRVNNKYIWCYEYFSENCEDIGYRGNKNMLWKNNFEKLFLDKYPDLKVVKEKKLKYKVSDNIDVMFLLEKSSSG